MLSIQTEARIIQLLLEIAKGENTIESTRRMMTNNYDFDSYQIFNYLDTENKNRIDSLDLINYLTYKQINVTDIEAQLIILFYDQNFDGVLSYDEFKPLVMSENSLSSKPTANNFLGKISPEIDDCLLNILENEVRLSKNVLSLINDLKSRKDFNIHSIYHLLRGNYSINDESLINFLTQKDVIFNDNDIISIRRRIDLNKDNKIDLCELHAFLGYPECSICCPSTPCPVCQMRDCNICFKDSSCFFHNRFHDEAFTNYKVELRNNPSYNIYIPKLDIKNNYDNNNVKDYNSSNNNSINNINLEFSNKTSPQINHNNFNINYNYDDSFPKISDVNYSMAKNSSSQKVSKNLALRASPERKFSPKRITSPFSKDLNINNRYRKNNNNINNYLEINNIKNNNLFETIKNVEKQFLNYLRQAMITEKKIEEHKIKLSQYKDFNCEDAFRIFENDKREYITKEDLKYGLNLLNIYPSSTELDLLMNKYTLNNKKVLVFSDFFDVVVPYEKEFRNLVEDRVPNSTQVLRSPNIFTYNTATCLKDLFNFIINEENKLNIIRKDFSLSLKNNLERFFNEIDTMKNKYFENQDFLLYLRKKGIFIDENACDLLFIRLDNNRNGTVELNEIEKEFKSTF